MFGNDFRISLRRLFRQPLYSIINILGLTIALAFVLLVSLFIRHEFSYDTFHEHSKHLYRLTTTYTNKEGNTVTVGSSGQVQGPAFKAAIPGINDYVRIFAVRFNVVNEKKALSLQGLFADKQFLNLFSFSLLYGHAEIAFQQPDAVLLTRKAALKFFGKADVIGQSLNVEHGSFSKSFRISGIINDLPEHSSIQFEILVPFSYLQESWEDKDWLNQYLSTFLLLNPNVDPTVIAGKFNSVFLAAVKSQLSDGNQIGRPASRSYGLQPISDLHLNRTGLKPEDAGRNSTGISAGSLSYVMILAGIAVFILIMAAVNFVNLAVAGSFRRTKEIAVRKITGSSRKAIIRQFILEAALLCIAAFFLAMVLSYSLLPALNTFLGKQLSFIHLIDVRLLLCWVLLIILTTLLSGIYPAILLSRFKPVAVLSGKLQLTKGHWLGKTLVVFQFVIAMCLLVSTITYYRQMHFIAAKDLGYNAGNIVRFFIPMENSGQNVPRLKEEIRMQNFVRGVATATDNNVAVLGGVPTILNDREVSYVDTAIDTSFLSVMNIPLIAGRNFSAAHLTDRSTAAIVNESFVKAAGLTDPIGSQFKNTWGAGELRTIIGVVKDYHFSSLKDNIYPQVMLMTNDLPFFWVRIQNGREQEVVEKLTALSKKYAPAYPFEFSFLEDEINLLYQPDKRWQQVVSYATLLSFFICSIGLFGLAHLAASERTREIGVRKVLGASVSGIVSLLCKDVVKLLLVAELIAFPIAWMVMRNWLQDYAYRIELSWVIFLAAGIGGMLISLFTISYHSIKAATANPVKSLRTE